MQAIQFNSHGRGTNSPVEHYTGGHGMSFCLEDQKPQPPEPPSPPLGLFFFGTSGRDHVGLAAAESLPRSLTCSACGDSRRVEIADGARIRNTAAFMERLGLGAGSAR
jgi:hypothetical protein